MAVDGGFCLSGNKLWDERAGRPAGWGYRDRSIGGGVGRVGRASGGNFLYFSFFCLSLHLLGLGISSYSVSSLDVDYHVYFYLCFCFLVCLFVACLFAYL